MGVFFSFEACPFLLLEVLLVRTHLVNSDCRVRGYSAVLAGEMEMPKRGCSLCWYQAFANVSQSTPRNIHGRTIDLVRSDRVLDPISIPFAVSTGMLLACTW